MSSLLRRIDAPTRYAGLPLKGWLGVAASVIVAALVIAVFKTPLAPTLVVLSWFVASPTLLLALWAHQQGVSVVTLIADFTRYAARRKRRQLRHIPAPVLRGGVVLAGPLAESPAEAVRWTPSVDLEEVV